MITAASPYLSAHDGNNGWKVSLLSSRCCIRLYLLGQHLFQLGEAGQGVLPRQDSLPRFAKLKKVLAK